MRAGGCLPCLWELGGFGNAYQYVYVTDDGSGGHQLYDAVLDDQGGEGLRANLGAEGAGLRGPHTAHTHTVK